jgi:hypothetical protein
VIVQFVVAVCALDPLRTELVVDKVFKTNNGNDNGTAVGLPVNDVLFQLQSNSYRMLYWVKSITP